MGVDVDQKNSSEKAPVAPEVGGESEQNSNIPPRYGLGAVYGGFAVYVLFFAPGSWNDAGQLGLILSGKLGEANDVFFAIFNLLGAASVNFAALLNAGAPRQGKLSTNLFSLAGFFVGFWAFGPYLIGREYAPNVVEEEVRDCGVVSRLLESKILGIGAVLYSLWAYAFALGLFSPGTIEYHDVVLYASVVDLFRLLSYDRGACSTCLDCVILCTVIWGPLTEDMSRRGWFKKGKNLESVLTALSFMLVPVLGPAVYLVLRPPLPSRDIEQAP